MDAWKTSEYHDEDYICVKACIVNSCPLLDVWSVSLGFTDFVSCSGMGEFSCLYTGSLISPLLGYPKKKHLHISLLSSLCRFIRDCLSVTNSAISPTLFSINSPRADV